MISRRDLERLAALEIDEGILSAYITIDPALAYDRGQALSRFKESVTRFARASENRKWLPVLEREKPKLLDYLETWPAEGRGVAIFSSEAAGIWEVHLLDVLVPSYLVVDRRPHVEILAHVLDEHPAIAAALIDGDDARIYLIEQGATAGAGRVQSYVPNRHDQGGWAQARYQRHVEFHGDRHRRKVVEELQKLYYTQPFDRLALVAVSEVATEVSAILPDPLKRLLMPPLTADFKQEGDSAILDRVRDLRMEEERRSEESLLKEIEDKTAAGGLGALGVDEVLRAVFEGRVHVLALAAGLKREGWQCRDCDYFSAERFDRCPACGGDVEQLPDVVEHALEAALRSGAKVEVVFGAARDALLAHGGLGAVLRY